MAINAAREELEAGLDTIRTAPRDGGKVEMIVRRPSVGQREVLDGCELTEADGLTGDCWRGRPSSRTQDGSAHPDMQIAIMNSRAIQLVALSRERWPLAGDQFFLDMDLSEANLPTGARVKIGTAILEVTDQLHTGCKKFSSRFGVEALKFLNSQAGKELRLRGIYAKVVLEGRVRQGDVVNKIIGDSGR